MAKRSTTIARHKNVIKVYDRILGGYEPKLRKSLSRNFIYSEVAEELNISPHTVSDIIRGFNKHGSEDSKVSE